MAYRDLSRYRIMSSYVLTHNSFMTAYHAKPPMLCLLTIPPLSTPYHCNAFIPDIFNSVHFEKLHWLFSPLPFRRMSSHRIYLVPSVDTISMALYPLPCVFSPSHFIDRPWFICQGISPFLGTLLGKAKPVLSQPGFHPTVCSILL